MDRSELFASLDALGLDEAAVSPVVSTGIAGIDEALGGGLNPGLTILAGAPKTGKSAVAMQVWLRAMVGNMGQDWTDPAARYLAGLFVELEMPEAEMERRAVTRLTKMHSINNRTPGSVVVKEDLQNRAGLSDEQVEALMWAVGTRQALKAHGARVLTPAGGADVSVVRSLLGKARHIELCKGRKPTFTDWDESEDGRAVRVKAAYKDNPDMFERHEDEFDYSWCYEPVPAEIWPGEVGAYAPGYVQRRYVPISDHDGNLLSAYDLVRLYERRCTGEGLAGITAGDRWDGALVVADYIQKLACGDSPDNERVKGVVESLVRTALSFPRCAVLGISTLSREHYAKKAGLAAFAGSQGVEYSMNAAIVLRVDEDARDVPPGCKAVIADVFGTRDASGGVEVPLLFEGATGCFKERDR